MRNIYYATEKVDLLPCPFCGGESEMKKERHAGGRKGADNAYTPRCKNPSCAGRLSKKWLNLNDAISAWNKRM